METKTNTIVRILLLDDHTLFRESLSRLLQAEPGFHILGSCQTITEALGVMQREAADIVLLDYDLGDQRGLALMDEMRRSRWHTRVLMVTAGINEADTLRLMEQGVCGIFLKHCPPQQLVEAIHQVMRGQMWLDSKTVRALLAGGKSKPPAAGDSSKLSGREREVLQGVLEGQSNKEIAAAISLSESSVKATLQQLFDKTGVRTRSQLVRIALEKHGQDWLNG